MLGEYTVLDFETNILNKEIGNNKASPFWEENDIVLGQFRYWVGDDQINDRISNDPGLSIVRRKIVKDILSRSAVLVGHNIKFDLLYLRKFYNELYRDWVKAGGQVWDTQIVEYLLSGQSKLYPTLDYCSEKYGGTLKDDKIKEYWNKGIDTADIPREELLEYLNGDIDNTELVFVKQWEMVDSLGMLPLVVTQMNALLALVEMEHNGMEFFEEEAAKECEILSAQLALTEMRLQDKMREFLPANMKAVVSPGSPQQLSAVLFGGEVRTITEVAKVDGNGLPMIFKSGVNKGKVKTRKEEGKTFVTGLALDPTGPKSKSGQYPTDDEALQKLLVRGYIDASINNFIEDILYFRMLAKDIKTYYIGYSKLQFPDGKIHPNFNQCSTATGRLSSTSPNAQNLSNGED